MSTLLVLAFVLAVAGAMSDKDYCDISPEHTLCLYPGLSDECGTVLTYGLTSEDIENILHQHNKLRSRVATGKENRGPIGSQPSASNMRAMEWDEELAKIAQRWADQCQFAHDVQRDVKGFTVGQNIYMTTRSKDQEVKDAIREATIGEFGWFSEVKLFENVGVDNYEFNHLTGHYTQLIWGETYKIGCGHITFQGGIGINKLIVCNYGPAGNFIGDSVYDKSGPCTRCPQGTRCSKKYEGLCESIGGASSPPSTPSSVQTIPITSASPDNSNSDSNLDSLRQQLDAIRQQFEQLQQQFQQAQNNRGRRDVRTLLARSPQRKRLL